MTVALLALAGVLLALPGLRACPARSRLAPADRARMSMACLVIGSTTLLTGLLLLAAPTIFEAVNHSSALATTCARVVDGLSPGGPIVGWLAAAIAALVAGGAFRAVVRGRRRARAAIIEPWLGRHIDRGQFELVILPTRELVAVGVPSEHPQIVVSEGLVDSVTEDELEAVIRHEAAHHRLGHVHFLRVAAMVETPLGWLPFVRRSTARLRDSLERWADDAAAAEAPGGSIDLQRAIVSVAVAKAAIDAPPWRAQSTVLERAARLSEAPRSPRRVVTALTYAPIAIAGISALALVAAWLTETHHAVALTGYCPS